LRGTKKRFIVMPMYFNRHNTQSLPFLGLLLAGLLLRLAR